jgi:hypothetical protein
MLDIDVKIEAHKIIIEGLQRVACVELLTHAVYEERFRRN